MPHIRRLGIFCPRIVWVIDPDVNVRIDDAVLRGRMGDGHGKGPQKELTPLQGRGHKDTSLMALRGFTLGTVPYFPEPRMVLLLRKPGRFPLLGRRLAVPAPATATSKSSRARTCWDRRGATAWWTAPIPTTSGSSGWPRSWQAAWPRCSASRMSVDPAGSFRGGYLSACSRAVPVTLRLSASREYFGDCSGVTAQTLHNAV